MIWDTASRMLTDGERSGRIETVRSEDRRLSVYKCESCARCGGAVSHASLANRSIYWCAACQSGEVG